VHREWLESRPEPGEALVDTGLSSAADCEKLRWSLGDQQRAQFSELLARSVARDRELFKDGNLEAEAQRISDLVGPVLKAVGLDPTTFGVSMPKKLPLGALLAHSRTNMRRISQQPDKLRDLRDYEVLAGCSAPGPGTRDH
jgi:hypothetical protein